jgi:hypothetical protein
MRRTWIRTARAILYRALRNFVAAGSRPGLPMRSEPVFSLAGWLQIKRDVGGDHTEFACRTARVAVPSMVRRLRNGVRGSIDGGGAVAVRNRVGYADGAE